MPSGVHAVSASRYMGRVRLEFQHLYTTLFGFPPPWGRGCCSWGCACACQQCVWISGLAGGREGTCGGVLDQPPAPWAVASDPTCSGPGHHPMLTAGDGDTLPGPGPSGPLVRRPWQPSHFSEHTAGYPTGLKSVIGSNVPGTSQLISMLSSIFDVLSKHGK